ncbi:ABC transporter permease [Roseinatronobacter monicus]|uniref:Transport permease protein n=1 Tax=Roseinatronobacter monicus TaxID=393481 RepID=A0A543K5K5_9RHOB|nr:ABC transporter permease [Roseinatronobacter monicus]TQM90352.1 capsular polysaccharide transport system permease protein [Roseinatronobacter monicus]
MSTVERSTTRSPRHTESYMVSAIRCIAALVLREMGTRYGRQPGGYVWALVQPLGMIILLSFAFSLLARSPALGTSFLLFKATGMLILQLFNNVGGSVGQSMSYSKSLLFYPRVTWLDAVVARFLLNGLVTLVVTFIILTGIIIYDDVRTVLDWSKIFLGLFLTLVFGLGVGSLNCFLFMRFPVWQNIWAILTAPLFIISGVIFLYEDLPTLAQQILWWNPLIHITGVMRDGFYPTYSPRYISILYVLACALIPMVVGLMLMRQFHRDLLNR